MRVNAIIFGMAGILFAGCDKPASNPVATTTTHPAVAATAPATTKPTASFIRINDRLAMFPPARLKLEADGLHLTALFFSDDPPEAIKDDYTGNSYNIPMALEIDDPKDLASATWTHNAGSGSEREDSPYGIFLNGRRLQLQPYNVQATFAAGAGDVTTIKLWGQFLMFDDRDRNSLPQMVAVAAEIPVQVETEGAAKGK